MSCILRCSGDQIDIQTLLAHTSLPIHSYWQKGTRLSPSIPNSKVHTTSGLRIIVSNAEFEEFHQQIQDTIIFFANASRSINAADRISWRYRH